MTAGTSRCGHAAASLRPTHPGAARKLPFRATPNVVRLLLTVREAHESLTILAPSPVEMLRSSQFPAYPKLDLTYGETKAKIAARIVPLAGTPRAPDRGPERERLHLSRLNPLPRP